MPGRLSSSTPALALPVPCSSALLTVSPCLPGLAILPSFLTLADHPGWGWGTWEGEGQDTGAVPPPNAVVLQELVPTSPRP